MQDVTKLRIWQRAWELRRRVERDLAGIDALAAPLLAAAHALVEAIEHGAKATSPVGFINGLNGVIHACNEFQQELLTAVRTRVVDKSRFVMLDLELTEIRRMTLRLRTRIWERSKLRRR